MSAYNLSILDFKQFIMISRPVIYYTYNLSILDFKQI